MKLNVLLVEDFPHPVQKVWQALTNPEALRAWLMDNDFEPRVGKRFTLRARQGRPLPPASRGWQECEVLEIEPPRRMVWSWRHNEGEAPTRVEFRLEEAGSGTRLTLSHTGETDAISAARLTEGWPGKLADLLVLLNNAV
jgi:uncharacterized protein YndB with AHSA1/START domain